MEAARRLAEAHGKKEDWKQARKWYRMAAKAGSAQAWHGWARSISRRGGLRRQEEHQRCRELSKAVEGSVQEAHLLLGQTLLERGQRPCRATSSKSHGGQRAGCKGGTRQDGLVASGVILLMKKKN